VSNSDVRAEASVGAPLAVRYPKITAGYHAPLGAPYLDPVAAASLMMVSRSNGPEVMPNLLSDRAAVPRRLRPPPNPAVHAARRLTLPFTLPAA